MMQSLLVISLGFTFLAFAFAGNAIPKFRDTPFRVRPDSGMYEIDNLNLNNVTDGNQIAAYGDFNNDKYTDFVSLSDDHLTFRVFLYSPDSASFWPCYTDTSDQPVASIVPADYDYNGLLDLMIVRSNPQDQPSPFTATVLYQTRDSDRFSEESPESGATTTLNLENHPFIFDVVGDRTVYVLLTRNGVRRVFSFKDQLEIDFYPLYVSDDAICSSRTSEVSTYNFATPHSNAFVDLNGDCAADLFITSLNGDRKPVFEIWLRHPDGRFCLVDATEITLPGLSMVTIADMDNNGRLDLVYIESPEDLSLPMNLHIVYNNQTADPAFPCKADGIGMVTPFAEGAYNKNNHTFEPATQVTTISTTFFPAPRLFSPDEVSHPSRARLGDINVDGLQDLLIVITNTTDQNSTSGLTLFGINNGKAASPSFFDDLMQNTYVPYFYVNSLSTGISSQVNLTSFPTLYASFFDFDEKGSLGLWITQYNGTDGTSSLIGIYNFVSTSNFMLKALGLNGIPIKDTIKDSVGGIYVGASVECTVTDIQGKTRIAKSTQLGQTAYNALDLPYAFIGLGRTNSYVQDFTMGITKDFGDNDYQQFKWTPMIPNSQLIVNTLQGQDWTLDIFVSPISQTMFVVMITSGVLFVLALVIVLLHIKEVREDRKTEDKILYVFG